MGQPRYETRAIDLPRQIDSETQAPLSTRADRHDNAER